MIKPRLSQDARMYIEYFTMCEFLDARRPSCLFCSRPLRSGYFTPTTLTTAATRCFVL